LQRRVAEEGWREGLERRVGENGLLSLREGRRVSGIWLVSGAGEDGEAGICGEARVSEGELAEQEN